MWILLLIAFISGLVTILTPCIWPILPIVMSSAIAGNSKARPLGITVGLVASFGVFTLAISFIVNTLHLNPNILRDLAVGIIFLMGLVLAVPAFSKVLESLVSRLTSRQTETLAKPRTDFSGGLLVGLSLGLVWAPCAGPILASIAALAITGQVTIFVVVLTLAYLLGLSIPLFFFAYGSQKLINNSKRLSAYTGLIQQTFGFIMILIAVLLYTNFDKVIQLKLADWLPNYSSQLTALENNPQVQNTLNSLTNPQAKKVTIDAAGLATGLFNVDQPAPEITGITHWLNTDQPLTIAGLKGKVVLIDFWTYTCINCIRTLPHVTAWYQKYKDQGLVIIGVHTPEFEFEKNTANVSQAIAQYNITYPVAQDNDYATWNNFNNHYWPAEYLIDATGQVRRAHFGEGDYDQTEQAIQALLIEAGQKPTTTVENMPDQTPTTSISPESYIGYARAGYYYPLGQLSGGSKNFSLTDKLPLNNFSLGGDWDVVSDQATAGAAATLNYHFIASKVFLVLRPAVSASSTIKVYLGGQLINNDQAGADVKDGLLKVDQDRLYNLVDLKSKTEEHVLKLEFQTPGIQAFAFTFG